MNPHLLPFCRAHASDYSRSSPQFPSTTPLTPILSLPPRLLPSSFSASHESSHSTFSSYRDHAQQHGPLRKTIKSSAGGIGGHSGSELGPVSAPKGTFFDRNELPARFRRAPLTLAEIESIETGWGYCFCLSSGACMQRRTNKSLFIFSIPSLSLSLSLFFRTLRYHTGPWISLNWIPAGGAEVSRYDAKASGEAACTKVIL